ncbi:MAG: hypothetical protein LBM27_06415 [Lactobacillaceae bacterium]|jgi:hypothetical protein|nr:hypothetical protein [Lactobacillaceae bacterium]
MTLKGLFATAAVITAISTQNLQASANDISTRLATTTGQIIRKGVLNLQIGDTSLSAPQISIDRALVKGDTVQVYENEELVANFEIKSAANSFTVSGTLVDLNNDYQIILNGHEVIF